MGIFKRLDAERERRGLTWNQIAKATGLSRSVFTKWKAGQTPDIESLVEMANFFGMTLDQLVGRLPTPNARLLGEIIKPPERDLLKLYRTNPKIRKLIDALRDLARK